MWNAREHGSISNLTTSQHLEYGNKRHSNKDVPRVWFRGGGSTDPKIISFNFLESITANDPKQGKLANKSTKLRVAYKGPYGFV